MIQQAASVPTRTKTGDAFEDVLYGSDSEEESDAESADESKPAKGSKQKNKAQEKSGMRLRLDNDEPMDLLHGSAAHLATGSSTKRRQPGRDAAKFRTEALTGRMVIEESSDEGEDRGDGDEVAGAAYREMITSADGQTRDASGRVRFGKDTKKRRAAEREAEAAEDTEMADGTGAGGKGGERKKKKQAVVKVGAEFKAKVSSLTVLLLKRLVHFNSLLARRGRREEVRSTRSVCISSTGVIEQEKRETWATG